MSAPAFKRNSMQYKQHDDACAGTILTYKLINIITAAQVKHTTSQIQHEETQTFLTEVRPFFDPELLR